jgi:hypothetical protein
LKQPSEATPPVPLTADSSQFMRPFAIGMTAYLVAYNILFMVTRGQLQSQDAVSDVYFFVLATYAGAPEVKRWTVRQAEDPEGWAERIRKGGPLITLWFLLWAGAVLWRIYDPTVPMPAELKAITLQVMGLFFGTYALRQVRKRSVRGVRMETAGDLSTERPLRETAQRVYDFLLEKKSASPREIREALELPRTTVTRALAELLASQKVTRDSQNPQDPAPQYSPLHNP